MNQLVYLVWFIIGFKCPQVSRYPVYCLRGEKKTRTHSHLRRWNQRIFDFFPAKTTSNCQNSCQFILELHIYNHNNLVRNFYELFITAQARQDTLVSPKKFIKMHLKYNPATCFYLKWRQTTLAPFQVVLVLVLQLQRQSDHLFFLEL